MASNSSIFHRIWVYSKSEAEKLKQTNKGISSQGIILGNVVTDGGIYKTYTSIVRKREDIAYPDAVVVAEGDIRKVHYTHHTI